MSTLGIILVVFVVVLFVLAVGGAFARRRQLERTQGRFEADLAAVNRDLAAARAGDRGWHPERMEAAARSAWAAQGGGEPQSIELYQVVDRPGTDADEAVYRVVGDGGESLITLARTGDDWHAKA